MTIFGIELYNEKTPENIRIVKNMLEKEDCSEDQICDYSCPFKGKNNFCVVVIMKDRLAEEYPFKKVVKEYLRSQYTQEEFEV